jgi:hypothetical protein
VNLDILRVLRALFSELKTPSREWPDLLPLVQGNLNAAILPRLGKNGGFSCLVTGDKCEVHGSRILFFRNSDREVTKEVIDHIEYQTGELHTVSELVDVLVWQSSVDVQGPVAWT